MLQTKQVGDYVVSQAGMIHAVRRVNMVKKLQEAASQYDEETLTALAVYPHIAGCVSPIISIEQFMEMPETQLDALTVAAMELNPHWFSVPEEDQEKKTETPPSESTPDSEAS